MYSGPSSYRVLSWAIITRILIQLTMPQTVPIRYTCDPANRHGQFINNPPEQHARIVCLVAFYLSGTLCNDQDPEDSLLNTE